MSDRGPGVCVHDLKTAGGAIGYIRASHGCRRREFVSYLNANANVCAKNPARTPKSTVFPPSICVSAIPKPPSNSSKHLDSIHHALHIHHPLPPRCLCHSAIFVRPSFPFPFSPPPPSNAIVAPPRLPVPKTSSRKPPPPPTAPAIAPGPGPVPRP